MLKLQTHTTSTERGAFPLRNITRRQIPIFQRKPANCAQRRIINLINVDESCRHSATEADLFRPHLSDWHEHPCQTQINGTRRTFNPALSGLGLCQASITAWIRRSAKLDGEICTAFEPAALEPRS